MNKNLNLVEILKDVPKGTKLWSPICGECEFVGIRYDESRRYPIMCKALGKDGINHYEMFTDSGTIAIWYEHSECMLFPSKENRDWSTFKAPKQHKHFEPYQKVLVKEYCAGKCRWILDYYCFHNSSPNRHYLVGTGWAEDKDIIPYEGNEDKVGKAID